MLPKATAKKAGKVAGRSSSSEFAKGAGEGVKTAGLKVAYKVATKEEVELEERKNPVILAGLDTSKLV